MIKNKMIQFILKYDIAIKLVCGFAATTIIADFLIALFEGLLKFDSPSFIMFWVLMAVIVYVDFAKEFYARQ